MGTILPVVHAIGWAAVVLALLGALYTVLAAIAAFVSLRRDKPVRSDAPDVTVIKPLKGHQPNLGVLLEGFCLQDYLGKVQIVFGVHDAADPAIGVVRDLQRRHPDLDIELRIDPRIHGANLKASNLINIVGAAKHEILVLSDADIEVGPHYLNTVVAALAKPGVGLVSCFYVGRGDVGLWSQLSAMAINYQFIPGAILGKALALAQPCFGSTTAIRADVLDRIGGLAAFADRLADDYEIGSAVRRLGLKIAFPPMLVAHTCDETRSGQFFGRQLRWGRAIRQISAWGYAGSIITYPFPLCLLAIVLIGPSPPLVSLLGGILAMRLCFKICMDCLTRARAGRWWLTPVSDILAFGIFIVSFGVNHVGWRGTRFRVSREGALLHP